METELKGFMIYSAFQNPFSMICAKSLQLQIE